MALVEFAYSLPLLLTLSLTGAEITHFVTVKMRISQLALHVADHGARMGTGGALAPKIVSETDINDLFIGAKLQGRELDVLENGRIIISSLEPVSPFVPATPRYRIGWQRCQGDRVHPSSYGVEDQTNMTGMGPLTPVDRQVKAPQGGAAMFVEISYEYQSILPFLPQSFGAITEIASMPVRENRQATDPTNAEGATASTCS